jgi:hypothetical protein
MLVGCGMPIEPMPAQQVAAVQPTATPWIIVVTATPRPATATPKPTATARPTRTPAPTQPPPPTAEPTATDRATVEPTAEPTATPAIAAMDDAAYAAYLASTFNTFGPRAITFEDVNIFHDRFSGEDFTIVSFYLNIDEVEYFNRENTTASRKAWARRVLTEIEARWPKQSVTAYLEWSYQSHDITSDSDCSRMGDTLFDDGWYHHVYFARASFDPAFGEDLDCF